MSDIVWVKSVKELRQLANGGKNSAFEEPKVYVEPDKQDDEKTKPKPKGRQKKGDDE